MKKITQKKQPFCLLYLKCGNSLISRFELDDDLSSAFKGENIQYNFKEYKQAVSDYKTTNSKEKKREVLAIIDEVKNNFKSSINTKTIVEAQKKQGLYHQEKVRLNNLEQFGEKIKKADKDKLKKLKQEAEKATKENDEILNNVIYHNAFEWRFEFPEVLDEKGKFVGFDVVIGNPPYMRIQEIQKTQPKEKEVYEKKYTVAKSSYDLANLFFEKAINISNNTANNSYIFPHKFFNSASTESFRDFLMSGKYIDKLVHFGANMIFSEADTYTCIANFSKQSNDGFDIYKAKFKDDFRYKMLNKDSSGFVTYNQLKDLSDLYGSNQWILLNGEASVRLFEKLYTSKITIKDKFERISQGIATGKDELYLFSGVENDDYIEGKFKNSDTLRLEKGIMKPFLKGKDVHRYAPLPTNLFILFPYSIDNDGKANIMSEAYISDKFPNTYKWLKETEVLHRKKDNKSTDDKAWYRYARKQGVDNFEKPRLSSMEICSTHPNITTNSISYHPTTVYSWFKKETTFETNEYLLGIINSKVMWWFLLNTGDTLQGDARRFKTNYLNPFPLPKDLSIDEQQPLINKVNQMLAIKKENPDTDTSLIEKEIDQMVYKLYNLTDEEINIIEES